VTEVELKQLVEVAEKATCASDLEPVVEIVRRLRLDGRVMDMATFEALVLRREIAPPPPDLNRQRLLAAEDQLIRSRQIKVRR
jgi:hypothetical protein